MTVLDMIDADWLKEPDVREACIVLLDGLQSSQSLDHYTFGTLQEIARVENNKALAKAAMYLASPKIGVLSTSLMYEDAGQFVELDAAELAEYAEGNGFVHPRSGRPIGDEHLFVVYVRGPAFGGAGKQ